MIPLFSLDSVSFTQPQWFWGLLFVPIIIWLLWRKEKQPSGFLKSTRLQSEIEQLEDASIAFIRKVLIGLRTLVFVLIIVALAGPFSWKSDRKLEDYQKGIDIILALDVSLSMFSRDFEPNRLAAAKKVAKEFVSRRNGDRIGLVVYAGESYTACPATLDYQLVLDQIDEVSGDYIDQGTAIGTGLGTAVSRLQSDSLSSKVIILLTDGSNNRGELSPLEAAELAKATNVRVYTIGVGSNSNALSPIPTPFGIRFEYMPVEIDEETLQAVADRTGGKYFRATDEDKLRQIYDEIESLEKQRFLNEVFESEPPVDPTWALILLLALLLVLWVVERTLFPLVD